MSLFPLHELSASRFETAKIFKQLNRSTRKLAELKGVASTIPNQGMLINTLALQEAKDSSEVESIITTHDDLFQDDHKASEKPATKEIFRYRQALRAGYTAVRKHGLLTCRTIENIQNNLRLAESGLRKVPETSLKNQDGQIIYTPPTPEKLPELLRDLERFINDDNLFAVDPLIKMALIHYQFESIHPFYDGNGRTGRIINVLYLVKQELLDIPVLYLSRHIVRTKSQYYQLFQAVRENDDWEAWVLYILEAVEQIAGESIELIGKIKNLFGDLKHQIRSKHAFYSQDLINNLFTHPYTTIARIQRELKVTRVTATKYLNHLVEDGILVKIRKGRHVYYINHQLVAILTDERMQ